MRVLRVVESKTARLTLDESQAASLGLLGRQFAVTRENFEEDEAATVIHCTRISPEHWNVFVDNAVGVIAIDDLQIIVEPKIPFAHLVFLLERANVVPRLEKCPIKVSEGATLLDLVARWYLHALEVLFRDDLLHDYREQHEAIGMLRGRLDPLGTANLYYSGRPLFSCTYEEYDVDTALNRLLKAAAERIAANGVFSHDLRRRSRLMARRFVDVGTLEPGDLQSNTDRRTAQYNDAVMLAKLLLRSASMSIQSGPRRAWAFLLPTPHAVQTAITILLSEYLGDCTTVRSASVSLGKGLTANPDLVFDGFNAVGDVKYKLLDGRWKRADLYQVVAFASALQSEEASILTFAANPRDVPPQVSFGRTNVTPIAWLADEALDPGTAATLLCKAVKDWLLAASKPVLARPAISA